MHASIERRTDLESGWRTYRLVQGDVAVEVAPEAGCNVRSIQFRGVELLRTPPGLPELRGTRYGVPVLYPSPNRVRGGVFSFEGRRYAFPPNHGPDFIHGLVCRSAWTVVEARERVDRTGASAAASEIECQFVFAPGRESYDLFPHPHVLTVVVAATNRSVRWTYRVDNSNGASRVPFGFGLHPWFRLLGPRSETFLTAPATHWMPSIDRLPTGRLVELSETKLDLGKPTPLEGLVLDDVYFGTTPQRPAVVDHRSAGLRIELRASDDFQHLVVFTPADVDAFCVENQTCSTDAHNLYAAGLQRAAGLQIAEPGEVRTGFVEWAFQTD